MFGGQDSSTAAPQSVAVNTSQDDALKGVADLVNGSVGATTPAPAASASPAASQTQSGTFLPSPSDVSQAGAPTLPDDLTAASSPAPASDGGSVDTAGSLLDIKQQALQQLTPLVSHLDQTPLERFRTTMMLIQASDNQALLKDAYDAAQKIEDEKTRAQALLDVVNEINYFTQQKDQL